MSVKEKKSKSLVGARENILIDEAVVSPVASFIESIVF